jgi:hypothetical protein
VIEEDSGNTRHWVRQRALQFLTLNNIVDNLESTSPVNVLSANQGRILDSKIGSLQGATRDRGSVLFAARGEGQYWTTVKFMGFVSAGTEYLLGDRLHWASPDESQVLEPAYEVTEIGPGGEITALDVLSNPGAWTDEFPYATIPLAGGNGTGADISIELDKTGFYTLTSPQITVGGADYKMGDAIVLNVAKGTLMDALYIVTSVDEWGEITGVEMSRSGTFNFWPADNNFTVYGGTGHGAVLQSAPHIGHGNNLSDIANPRINDTATVVKDETHEGNSYTWIYADYNGDGIPNWVPLNDRAGRDFIQNPVRHEELGANAVFSNNVQDATIELRHIADSAKVISGRFRGTCLHAFDPTTYTTDMYMQMTTLSLNSNTPADGIYFVTGYMNGQHTPSRYVSQVSATQGTRIVPYNMIAPAYVKVVDGVAYMIDRGMFRYQGLNVASVTVPVRLVRATVGYASLTDYDNCDATLTPVTKEVLQLNQHAWHDLDDVPSPQHGDFVRVIEDETVLATVNYGPLFAQKPCTTWEYDANSVWTNDEGKNSHWRMKSVEAPPHMLGAGGAGPGGRFRGVVPYGTIYSAITAQSVGTIKVYIITGLTAASLDSRCVGRYWKPMVSAGTALYTSMPLIYANGTALNNTVLMTDGIFPAADNAYGWIVYSSTATTATQAVVFYDRESASATTAVSYGTGTMSLSSVAAKYTSLADQRKNLTPYAITDPQPGDWCIALIDTTDTSVSAAPAVNTANTSIWVYTKGPGSGGYPDEITYLWQRYPFMKYTSGVA